jgi:mono/diheme cytochrome c family protein
MLGRFDRFFEWFVWGLAGFTVVLLLAGPRIVAHDSSAAAAGPKNSVYAAGAALFKGNCGGCHTLGAAGTSGVVGPALDRLKLDAATVTATMKAGPGAMPSFSARLSRVQTAAVASFVAQASR